MFSFLDAKENIPNISVVCKAWKHSLNSFEELIWECSFKKTPSWTSIDDGIVAIK
jgi:uncharacterized protein YdeI (YjbR/CyaY-like superfamily)